MSSSDDEYEVGKLGVPDLKKTTSNTRYIGRITLQTKTHGSQIML